MASDTEMKTEESKEDIKEEDVKEETKDVDMKDEKDESIKEETKDADAEEAKQAMPKMVEEGDAPEDSRPKIAIEDVHMDMTDATCNAMTAADRRLLMTLCDGGFQYLLAGARCTHGMKSGRYFFEIKIVETLNPAEGQRPAARTPTPRQLLRLGISMSPSNNLLDDSNDKAYFDSEGYFVFGRKRTRAATHFNRDQVVGLLLNLDAGSLNANTLSLFRDGLRIADPQPIPEHMVGKTLYPCITWKNFTVQVNFGPTPKKPLPFKCRMLADAAAADLEHTPSKESSSARKNEVLFPVGLPDQGLFDWLDSYLEQNSHCVELSDRKVIEWAKKSGVYRQQGRSKQSIDKPGMNFGIPLLDDENVQKTLAAVAPALRRDFVHMELKSNLIEKERKEALARFPSSTFKKVALVVMGEPPDEYKTKVLEWTLSDKVEKAKQDKYREDKKRKWEEPEKKWEEKEQKELEKEEKKEPEKEEGGDDAPKDGEGEKEVEKEGEAKDVEKTEEMEADEEKPIELSEEEKKIWYYKYDTPDLAQAVLAETFASFSLPSKDEGFDEIRFMWQPEDKCAAHLKAWVLDLKKTLRAEDLEPSTWFKDKFEEWSKALSEWRRKHNDSRDKRAKATKEEEKKDEDKEKEEKDEGEEKGEEKEEKEVDEEPDVDKVEDVNDIGNGKPLYANFVYEDWVLLSLRFELHLLIHAFKRDLDDPDRPGFAEGHLAFYFNKYYKKQFALSHYKMTELKELVELIKENVTINAETGFLEAVLCDDVPLDRFMRLTEDNRRERQRCIDAGDETANLKFERPNVQPPAPRDKGGKGRDRGGPPPSRGGPVGGSSSGGPPPRSNAPPRGSYTSSSKGGNSRGGYSNPPPAREAPRGGSYGGGGYGSAGKRPAPPPAPYASKQPRYGGSGAPQSRSSYPPPSSGYGGGRSYR
jgi:hypothetical protein